MTPNKPDHFDDVLTRMGETVATLRELGIPGELVHSLSVEFWSTGSAVQIHIEGATEGTVALVNKVADHYGLPEADPEGVNYGRGQYLGVSPVHVYCGRPEPKES